MTTTPTVRRYQFLGMHLAVTGTRAVLEALHSRLRYFPSAEQALPDLSFDFISLDPGSARMPSRPPRVVAGPSALRWPTDSWSSTTTRATPST